MRKPTWGDRFAAHQHPINQVPIMKQHWRHLLFLHWEYDVEIIQKTLPPGLYVDELNGKAYVGIAAFSMENIKVKYLPSLFGETNFLELNLRTYVYDETGTPGVWFYSLDANHYLAVKAAQYFFHLPYRYASMQFSVTEDELLTFTCRRLGQATTLKYTYREREKLETAKPGSLEFFLIERYILYSYTGKQLKKGHVYHSPYLFCLPQIQEWDSRLFSMDQLIDPSIPPYHVLYSPGVDVDIYPLQAL